MGTLPRRRLVVLLAVVLANYAAQVPYALDLYGTHVSMRGVGLLAATLAWFLAGVAFDLRGRHAGYWLLLSFLVAEFLFYFHGQILGIARGYGLVYLLVHARDPIVRAVFAVGDVNFAAAGYFAAELVWRHRRRARVSQPDLPAARTAHLPAACPAGARPAAAQNSRSAPSPAPRMES